MALFSTIGRQNWSRRCQQSGSLKKNVTYEFPRGRIASPVPSSCPRLVAQSRPEILATWKKTPKTLQAEISTAEHSCWEKKAEKKKVHSSQLADAVRCTWHFSNTLNYRHMARHGACVISRQHRIWCWWKIKSRQAHLWGPSIGPFWLPRFFGIRSAEALSNVCIFWNSRILWHSRWWNSNPWKVKTIVKVKVKVRARW